MLPSSHLLPMNDLAIAGFESPRRLADAFSQFVTASAQLESSYSDLKREVARLNGELADRNAALRRSLAENHRMRAMLEQMIDSVPCGVLVLDIDDRIVRINPEGRRLLGSFSRTARTLGDLTRTTQIEFEQLMASNDGQNAEICLNRKSGKQWLAIGRRELASTPIPGAGSQLRSVWTLRDITGQKQAEEQREAARRATVLAEISTILAHEIRNPLASLELFAGLIADGNAENAQWIGNLRAGIRSLSGTVNNVLSLNSSVQLLMTPVDLSACVSGAVMFARPIAEQAGVSLTFVPASEMLTVRANEDAIRQILLNLIANAVRHTPEGGHVHVILHESVRDGIHFAIAEVTDNGCGIAEEAMQHLFEAGFSGTGETPGLGLAVCRRLMEQQGGTVRVTSRIADGAQFQLEFPAI